MEEEEVESSHFTIEIPEQKNLKNVSFSGGGFRGLAFLGCVKALQEKELIKDVKSFAGSSVGALIATLVVCGVDYAYLKEVAVGACQFFGTFKLDFVSLLTRGNASRFGSSFGLYQTADLRDYLKTCIQNALHVDYDVTFSDLFARNPVELIITASCLETKTPFYFSHSTTKDTPISEALAISCSIPLLFGKSKYEDKTLVDGCLIEKLPMQCWPQEEIDFTMAFLLNSSTNAIHTNTLTDYIHALQTSVATSQDDGYLSKYKNAITNINSGNMVTHGRIPSPEEVNKVIYAAYFQTLSELARRNFIEEYSIPKSQEISNLILSEESIVIEKDADNSLINTLVVILLIISIIKVISI